jgi:hypothetical protein
MMMMMIYEMMIEIIDEKKCLLCGCGFKYTVYWTGVDMEEALQNQSLELQRCRKEYVDLTSQLTKIQQNVSVFLPVFCSITTYCCVNIKGERT